VLAFWRVPRIRKVGEIDADMSLSATRSPGRSEAGVDDELDANAARRD